MMASQENAPFYSLDDDEFFDAVTTNQNLNVSDSLYTSFDESVCTGNEFTICKL